MLVRFQGSERYLDMEWSWYANRDGFNGRILKKGGKVGIAALDTKAVRDPIHAIGINIRHRDNLSIREKSQSWQMPAFRDSSAPDETQP
jgi:hypothetical protein